VLAALVVQRRPEAARRRFLELQPLDERVEGEVEVEAALLAVADQLHPGPQLVHHRDGGRVALQLLDVGRPEALELLARELEPGRERVAPDDRGEDRVVRHYVRFVDCAYSAARARMIVP
jgi:hypothetical protein